MDPRHVLKTMARWLMKRAQGKRYPFVTVYSITHFCNYYCPMCPFGKSDKENLSKIASERDLATAQWKAVMTELAKYSVWTCVEGGEPTTRKDIMELLRHLQSLGTFVNLTTNCSLLHKFDLRDLSRVVDAVCCALDSIHADAYSKMRGVSPAMHRVVLDNIKRLMERRIPCHVNPVITKFNVDEFITCEYYEHVSKELGVLVATPTIVEYTPETCISYVRENQDLRTLKSTPEAATSLLPTREELSKVSKATLDYMKRKRGLFVGTPELYWKQILKYGRPVYRRCGSWKSVTVQANGTVRLPCWKFIVPTKEMSILNNNVQQMWNHPGWRNVEGCHECQFLACHWFASQNALTMGLAYFKGLGRFMNFMLGPPQDRVLPNQ